MFITFTSESAKLSQGLARTGPYHSFNHTSMFPCPCCYSVHSTSTNQTALTESKSWACSQDREVGHTKGMMMNMGVVMAPTM